MPEFSAFPEVVFHIYPTDCDMLGHLNHASMLVFMERARWAAFEHLLPIREAGRPSVFPVIRRVEIDYRAQTLPGDDLVIRSGIGKVGNTSYTIHQDARKLGTGEIVAEAKLVIVAIDRSGVPIPVPKPWIDAMPAWPN